MEASGWLRQWDQMGELQAGGIKQSDHSDEHREFRGVRAKSRAPTLTGHTEIKAFGCILMLFISHAVHADIVFMKKCNRKNVIMG